jgi:F0F1-type ATP synthase epsilon subunit
VIELCDGGILEVINGKVTIYSDTSYDLEEADRIEYLSRDGHMWVLISNGNTAFCNR